MGNEDFFWTFFPHLKSAYEHLKSGNRRFVYYTDSETALKIIQNEELWLRNASVMNDFSEIRYGVDLIYDVFQEKVGEQYRSILDGIFSGTIGILEDQLSDRIDDWEFETYISCLSIHEDDEDVNGRLSMWRAYGDTALVVNPTPLLAETDKLGVFSVPVSYITKEEFSDRMLNAIESIDRNRAHFEMIGQDKLVKLVMEMFFITAIATKHPGFKEEKEWRVYYRPTERLSPAIQEKSVVIGGSPQTVCALKLQHNPEIGMIDADIPTLLNRVIIGPTSHPYVSRKAFRKQLLEAAVEDVDEKIFASDIPLRV